MLPLRRPAALRHRKSKAMAGPAMPSRMPKEPMPNLIPMLRKNSPKFAKSTGRGKWSREVTKPRKSIVKRKYAPFSEYREVGRWATGPDSTLEPREIASRLMQTPAHEQRSTDKALWKQNRLEYHNSRTDEVIHMFDCPLKYRCKCKAKVRIIT